MSTTVFSIACALVAAASVGLGRCGGGVDEPGRQMVSEAEIAWIERYTEWSGDFNDAVVEAQATRDETLARDATVADLRESLEPVRACSRSFGDRVGEAPGNRLEAVAALIRRACANAERAAALDVQSFQGDPARVGAELDARWYRSTSLFRLADDRLDRLVGDSRRLPVRRGPSAASRVDPLYGRVATRLATARYADREVEVRCWSHADWDGLVRIVDALDPETDIDLAGFVPTHESRINLAPEVCGALDTLVYEKRRPGGEDALLVADGVGIFAHEIEHIVAPLGEAETECHGMQDIRRLARMLGAPRAYADELARLYWDELYEENDDEYRTPRCRNGGPLDRNETTDVWP